MIKKRIFFRDSPFFFWWNPSSSKFYGKLQKRRLCVINSLDTQCTLWTLKYHFSRCPMPSLIKIYALQCKEITSCLCPIEIQLITSTYSYGKNSYLSAGTIDFTLAIEIRSESTEVQASAFTRRKWFFFVCQFTLIYRSLWHGNTLSSLIKDLI